MEKLVQLLGNPFIITAAGAVFVGCLSWILLQALARVYQAQKGTAGEIVVTDTQSPTIRALLPTARVIGLTLHNLLGASPQSAWNAFAARVDKALASAGRPEGLNADEYLGLGFLSGLQWSMTSLIFLFMLFPDNLFSLQTLSYMVIGFLFGCFVWRNWLTTKKMQRQVAIQRQLPFALDLLTLAMEAGMDFTSALARIVSKTGSTPLGNEFALMLHEIQLGKTRSDALRDLSNRCDIQDLRTVVASLIQAEELGSSLGVVLRIQAAQQRERRSQSAEEKAMKAPIKMMFPMIFILMALGVIMIAPIAITYLKNFR